MKIRKKYILLVVVIIVIIVFVIARVLNNEVKLEKLTTQVRNVRAIDEYDFKTMGESFRDKIYEKYDTVQFGHYMQDKEGKNKIPIDWIVLDKKEDKVLLFSKYILDLKNFNDEYIPVAWGDCSLRKWLNEEFYNIAFSNAEKRQMLETTNINKGYKEVPFYNTEDSYDTVDKVFLLSQDEVNTYFENDGIYDSEWFKKSEIEEYGVYVPSVANATSRATDYVLNKYLEYYDLELEDVVDYNFIKDEREIFNYWLRNYACRNTIKNDEDKNRATIVNYTGCLSTDNIRNSNINGIRPAIWVSIEE